jgi:hypothetical protein
MDFTQLGLHIMLNGITNLVPLPANWRYQGARLKIRFGSYKFQGK